MLISVLSFVHQVKCLDPAYPILCSNNPPQSFSSDIITDFDDIKEPNSFDVITFHQLSWSSVIETEDLLTLSSGKGVIVAIIDSGIDTDNQVFKSLLWLNRSEIADDGLDNDGNGYVDDLNGWNFGDGDALVADKSGHGSNVAWIVLKCAPDATLMIMKVNSGSSNTFYTDAVVKALYYAVNSGAHVINLSLSLAQENIAVKDAVLYALKKGVMVVSSAGNSHFGTTFPGTMHEVITVGATSPDGMNLSWNSPSGSSIDITAPGKYVETVGLGGDTVFKTGTSFSAPMVSGAIAVLLSMNSALKPQTIEKLILHSARDLGDRGRDDSFGWGVLSGSKIRKAAMPAINATKTTMSISKETTSNKDLSGTSSSVSNTDSFEISCYLPPTDSYTDVYIALMKNIAIDEDKPDGEYIWWLDSNGIWKGNNRNGITSIASLRLDNNGWNILLFNDSGGIWKNFSPSGFEPGSYNIGIAVMGASGLLAPVSWSPIGFF
ncbi:MAG: S8 family serine peptidase [Desulfamplus sp.]|nr:S8 family serine peptidase [Desulfamplus sp.]